MTRDRAQDAAELLALIEAAARSVLHDPAVWAEEAARTDAQPLPWPIRAGRSGYAQLLRILATVAVDQVLGAMRAAEGPERTPTADSRLAEFQVVLRVVKRYVDAADTALCSRFGGTGRMSIKRELVNIARELSAEAAIRSGTPRAEAFKSAGISRAGAYRALHRKRSIR